MQLVSGLLDQKGREGIHSTHEGGTQHKPFYSLYLRRSSARSARWLNSSGSNPVTPFHTVDR